MKNAKKIAFAVLIAIGSTLFALLVLLIVALCLWSGNGEELPMWYVFMFFMLPICFGAFCTVMYCNSVSVKKKASTSGTQTLIFKNGKMIAIKGGDKQNWYNADYIISDCKKYDINDYRSVSSIIVPDFGIMDPFDKYGSTGMLDYVLRMKAGNCFNQSKKELCSALLWKSTELMFANKFCNWRRKDFERLITWHNQLGMYEEAQKAREYLSAKGYTFTAPVQESNAPVITMYDSEDYKQYEKQYISDVFESYYNNFDNIALSILESVLTNAKRFKSDLVVFHSSTNIKCEECAKFSGRVYSISGKDKRYPKLPDYVRTHGNFHHGCSCSIDLFSDYIMDCGKWINDTIKLSNRPFEDNRTAQEKEQYNASLEHISDEAKNEAAKEWDRVEYDRLLQLYPTEAPKSFSAYRRMKSGNTTGFKKLLLTVNGQ